MGLVLLGVALLLLGFLLGIYILWVLGIIAVVVGLVLWVFHLAGAHSGGRWYW